MADTQSPHTGEQDRKAAMRAAAEALAPFSGDAPDMPTRAALVILNAGLFPQYPANQATLASLTTAARQPETCEWCRGPHSVQDCPRLGGSGTPKAMADQSTEARLREASAAWSAFQIAREGMNAAIPAFGATPAERALYDERYKADHEAEREHRAAAFKLSQVSASLLDELTRLRAEVEARVDLEALCKRVFLHAHSDGWCGNQLRRDTQGVDAEKSWALYVSNGALAKSIARTTLNGEQANGG